MCFYFWMVITFWIWSCLFLANFQLCQWFVKIANVIWCNCVHQTVRLRNFWDIPDRRKHIWNLIQIFIQRLPYRQPLRVSHVECGISYVRCGKLQNRTIRGQLLSAPSALSKWSPSPVSIKWCPIRTTVSHPSNVYTQCRLPNFVRGLINRFLN